MPIEVVTSGSRRPLHNSLVGMRSALTLTKGINDVVMPSHPTNEIMHILTENGYTLSAIRNKLGEGGFGGTYGAESGLFEISVWMTGDQSAKYVTQEVILDAYESTMGWISADEIVQYARMLAAL